MAAATDNVVESVPDSADLQSTPTCSAREFVEKLSALKAEGKNLAQLHREAYSRAAGRLPRLGSLVDAEEDFTEALTKLRVLSPLLLLDGSPGVGKTSFINALLQDALAGRTPSSSSRTEAGALLPVARPRKGCTVIVRSPHPVRDDVEPRYLAGKPSLRYCVEGEEDTRQLCREEWLNLLCDNKAQDGESPQSNMDSPVQPLIFEHARASAAWGDNGLWLTELDIEDAASLESGWVASCSDVICLVQGSLGQAEEKRLRQHLELDRRVLLIVSLFDAESEPQLASLPDFEAKLRENLGSVEDGQLLSIHLVSLLKASSEEETGEAAEPWQEAWAQCRHAVKDFAAKTQGRRLATATDLLADAKENFVQWCMQGTKVMLVVTEQFQQDAEDIRHARDLITRNIDDAYLSHVFASVLLGKFAGLCKELLESPAPDLEGRWGRHATRVTMEECLRARLETGLRSAMRASLQEVTAEMAKQELPSLQTIQRVARRGTSLPWDAEVRALEVDLAPDQLLGFAMHFFGSISVGVLSGLGAVALETLLGELALGPVGLVAGVATFVAIGVQSSSWTVVREEFVQQVRSKELELVEKARSQLDFPGLCERRKRIILEKMDVVLQRLLSEIATMSSASGEFARCAVSLQQRQSFSRSCSGDELMPSRAAR